MSDQSEVNPIPTPQIPEQARSASQKEGSYRIDQIIGWHSDGIRGINLMLRIREEYNLSESTAYEWIRKAEDFIYARIKMSDEEAVEYLTKKFLEHAECRDRKVSIAALRELGKHFSYYPATKIEGKITSLEHYSEDELKVIADKS